MSAVRRSIAYSALDKYASQALAILTTAVMARLLTPTETGLYLTASAVILLADNFRTFGVGVCIVQARELNKGLVRSAFTLTLMLSLSIALAILLFAPTFATFYDAPELRKLLALAVLAFVAMPFGNVVLALLQREMMFHVIAGINIAAALANAVVTITLGFMGMGPISYIWGFIAASMVIAVLAFVARPDVSLFRPSFTSLRMFLSFGAVSSGITVLNMGYEMLPRLALGKLLGFDAVGLFSRAITICQLPERAIASAVHPVVLPAMSTRAREGGDLRQAFLHGLTLMSGIQWPALIMLSLLADPLVYVLLGPQWENVPPLARIMAIAMMALVPSFMTFPLLVASGRIRDALIASLISLPVSVAVIVAAARFGLTTVAASLLLIAPLQMAVALFFVRRAIDLHWSDLCRASSASAAIALATALIPGVVVLTSPTGFDLGWFPTVIAILGGSTGWLVCVHLTRHPLNREISGILSHVALHPRRLATLSARRTVR